MKNIVLLTQAFLLTLSFLLSLFIFSPVARNLSNFNGNCLLFASGEWINNETEPRLEVSWGEVGSCNFTVFVGVVLMLISLIYIANISIYLYKGTDQSWLSSFVAVIVAAVVSAMLMVCGIVLSTGFQQWCDLISEKKTSCDIGQYETYTINGDPNINKTGYYTQFVLAKFGVWMAFVCWFFLTLAAASKLYKYHQSEDIFVSMNRERERLIQSISHNAQHA